MKMTPLPNQFFNELLPRIDHLGELKVSLYCFWLLYQMEGDVRYVRLSEMATDETLIAALAPQPDKAIEALRDALERATQRGTLLHLFRDGGGDEDHLYLLNTARSRAALDGLAEGKWQVTKGPRLLPGLSAERPNVFTLYEQNIGALTPLVADKLRDLESTYSAAWISEAIGISVEHNKRNLAYVTAILDRWQREGKDSGRDKRRVETFDGWSYVEDEYAHIIEY